MQLKPRKVHILAEDLEIPQVLSYIEGDGSQFREVQDRDQNGVPKY